jgi:hypothetical protein
MTQPLSSQITDRNFLQANGFSFTVNRAPTLGFFGNAVNVPGLIMNTTVQPNYLRNIPRPGTQLDFNDLTIRFLVDQGLENYTEIQNWLRGIGFPESLSEIYEWQNTGPVKKSDKDEINLYSDGTMTILNGINRPVFSVVFKDLFPTSISDLQFDSQTTDVEYLTAQVTFKYSVYNITDVACC